MKDGYYRNRGHLIKKLRKSEKLTQRELADKLDISDSYISKYENGVASKNPKMEKKIYDFFKISETQLTKYGETKSINELIELLYYKKEMEILNIKIEDEIISIENRLWRLSKNIILRYNAGVYVDLDYFYEVLEDMTETELLLFEYLTCRFKINTIQNIEALQIINITEKRNIPNLKLFNLLKQLKVRAHLRLGRMFEISKNIYVLDQFFLSDRNIKRYEENQELLVDYMTKNKCYYKALTIIDKLQVNDNKKMFLYSKLIIDKDKKIEVLEKLINVREYKVYANLELAALTKNIEYLENININETTKVESCKYFFLNYKLTNNYDKMKNFIYKEAIEINLKQENYYELRYYQKQFMLIMKTSHDYKYLRVINKKIDKFINDVSLYKIVLK